MFTIILHDKDNNEVERLFLEGNEVYLQRDDECSFPELSSYQIPVMIHLAKML